MVPGVNPPAGTESDETIRPTWGVSAGALGVSPSGAAIVGAWESELSSSPHVPQNLFSDGFSAEHFGHWIIALPGNYENRTDYMESWVECKGSLKEDHAWAKSAISRFPADV
jgi:hypothetical protein